MSEPVEKEKYEHSIEVLKLASQMSEQYYGKPLLLSYSGGKDSDVLLQLALESGINIEVKNSHTTVDAPPTVYHIRETFDRLNKQGIKAEVKHSRYKDGRLITMWNLIEKKKFPPTRIVRYCCTSLKETTTPNRLVATGVRRDESSKRGDRQEFVTWSQTPGKRITKDLAEAKEVYQEAQEYDEVFDCRFITMAKKNKDIVANPILEWTEKDVWAFLKDRNVKTCELYNMGLKRVGCVGCPMASPREREREFKLFPLYKENYIKAFDRMDKSNYGRGGYITPQSTGKDVFDWWTQDPRFYGQEEFDGWRED